ncbi:ATP-dependent helicase [Nocardioides mangrovicus]|uniref:DNA 3'-5' helicase n=1 Tax=Nocardioides mangrovicus TaxID=2478913 RepID=A0A3L8P7H2_9ACTN|nr:ATP-dependent DNA helicase [Nocardioides mangrovicus]RLV50892.1 ATP-dependent helicase [Nocardioides mangrovicus]
MTTYRLRLPEQQTPERPELDADQQRVVEHPGGPLVVLAGPGTGKTTTLVEAIVDRVERRGVDPAGVLALTFSRKAAEQLRDRVTARLGRTLATNPASTFHSFAYALVRRYSPADLYAAPLRLLSAPEQDVLISELLTGEGALVWPDTLAAAVRTRGFAAEVQAVLSRARERGLDPVDLVELGERSEEPAYVVAGRFLQRYLVVLDDSSAVDYADLVRRAVQVAEQHREEIRARYSCVFVDEYQDTDPSQVALLQALAGDGRDLVVVGDPDQSIYGFRGADVDGILRFPSAFPTAGGAPAPVVALRTTRRFGSRLLVASQRVASGIGTRGDIGREAWAAFRSPVADAESPGAVEALTFDTARAEVEHLADLLRRAHLEDGVPWSQMAVLVRSGRSSLPALRRSLTAGGVPVEVAADDTPVVREPAVMPLLAALSMVVDAEVSDPDDPRFVGADRVEELLVSPLGRLDATDVRGLARALRGREVATSEGGVPRSSRELLRRCLLEPELLTGLSGHGVAGARRLAALLARAGDSLRRGETVEEVLWSLWDGTDWGERLRTAAQGAGAAARYAHRDLDALCALFETAARAEEQRGHTSVQAFLETLTAQEIPSDTLAERGVRGDAVRLLTAHRAKGLEWRLVVVAHVQDGAWPDLRRRGSLLNPDRLGADGLLPPVATSRLLAEERRLFYVACTRARERLVVTAVRSPDDDGEQPSRFLGELGRDVTHRVGRPVRPLSMPGLVAELRRTLADPAQPEALRQAAATRLARLARIEVGGRAVAPQADPQSWWGMREPTASVHPLRDPDQPVTVSASLLQSLLDCPAKWFLEREAGGARVSTASQGFGTVVHALADRLATGDLAPGEDLMALVDEVWPQMEFRTPWSREREREAVEAALLRFELWQATSGRRLLGTEVLLDTEVALAGGETVRLRGYADRLELDAEGRVVVVDLKTGKYHPTDKSVKEGNPQLSLYQLAVDHGAADELVDEPTSAAGAELVHLRVGVGDGALPKVQRAPADDDGPEQRVREQLAEVVRVVRGEQLVARPEPTRCDRCDFTPICPAHVSGSVLS